MNNFRINSNTILGILTILSIAAILVVEYEKVVVKRSWYEEKLTAATLSRKAAETLRQFRMQHGIFIDIVNDPNETALIGQEHTPITTDRGNIEQKLSTTNPNYAGAIVHLLKEAGIGPNDVVAVAITGSFPGLNTSLYAALETIRALPLVITSVGSSNWGANDPNFTWLDMEKVLIEAKVFSTRSIAGTIGGGADRGIGLSPEGRSLLLDAITRNGIETIHENHLEQSIERRIEAYDRQAAGRPIKAYINIGGGIASLGSSLNTDLIPQGLSIVLPMKNYPMRGTLIRLAERGIPIIHLDKPEEFERTYGLPANPVPLPVPGTGEIFQREQYNVHLAATMTGILIAAFVAAIYLDRKRHRLGTDVVPTSDADELG